MANTMSAIIGMWRCGATNEQISKGMIVAESIVIATIELYKNELKALNSDVSN